MFDLPIPQPDEQAPAVTTFRPPSERFRAEALEYEGGNIRGIDWIAILGAAAGVAFGYFVNGGNQMFTASLLSTAVFLYVSRR